MEVQELWKILWLPWDPVNSFFPLSSNNLLFFVLRCSFQFSVLRPKWGRKREGQGSHGLPPFPSCLVWPSCQLCSELCRWHPLWPCAKLQRSKGTCAGTSCLHLCAPLASRGALWAQRGWAKQRLVQVLQDEDKVI